VIPHHGRSIEVVANVGVCSARHNPLKGKASSTHWRAALSLVISTSNVGECRDGAARSWVARARPPKTETGHRRDLSRLDSMRYSAKLICVTNRSA